MAQTQGLVISASEDGWAQVVTERNEACAECASRKNCHSSCSSIRVTTKVLNTSDAKTGDHVSISLDSDAVLKGAAALYLIPIAGLLAGAFTGAGLSEALGIGETASPIIFGFAGLSLGFGLTAFISKRMASNNRLTPVVSKIIRSHMRS